MWRKKGGNCTFQIVLGRSPPSYRVISQKINNALAIEAQRHPTIPISHLDTSNQANSRWKMTDNVSEASALLRQLQQEQGDLKQNLSIIRIAEPISDVGDAYFSPSKRGSDVSLSNLNDPTPASLEADLTHYKVCYPAFYLYCQVSHPLTSLVPQELFSKLRFSYLEQVTKEKFLRAIVGDPPLVVGHNENVELETQLAEVKAELKARKEEARMMIEEMEKISRNLAGRKSLLGETSLHRRCP